MPRTLPCLKKLSEKLAAHSTARRLNHSSSNPSKHQPFHRPKQASTTSPQPSNPFPADLSSTGHPKLPSIRAHVRVRAWRLGRHACETHPTAERILHSYCSSFWLLSSRSLMLIKAREQESDHDLQSPPYIPACSCVCN